MQMTRQTAALRGRFLWPFFMAERRDEEVMER
jgi:hypothetical protein